MIMDNEEKKFGMLALEVKMIYNYHPWLLRLKSSNARAYLAQMKQMENMGQLEMWKSVILRKTGGH